MNPLQHPDNLHLEAAQGWLDLGNFREASEELEQIAPELKSHPDVLEVRWQVFAHAKEWCACVDIADAIIKLVPDRVEGWLHRSFALHELKRTREAFDKLVPVSERFPKVWTVTYNLACYCAQLGRLDEAQTWFKRAMAINKHAVQQSALDDPDLKPLWDSLSNTIWKRSE